MKGHLLYRATGVCFFFLLALVAREERTTFGEVEAHAWAEIDLVEDHFDCKIVGSNIFDPAIDDPSGLVHFYDLSTLHKRGDKELSLIFLDQSDEFPQKVVSAYDMKVNDLEFRGVITFVGHFQNG